MARYPPLHLGFWIVGCAVGLASCLNVAQAEEGPSDVAIFQLAMRVVDAGAQVDGLSEALSVATDTANSESDREMARQLELDPILTVGCGAGLLGLGLAIFLLRPDLPRLFQFRGRRGGRPLTSRI